ncbi:MAG: iron complex outermembrane receptor protein [Brevundimonas sp.]|jgi:iron complex outermembrane receptor protein|uniref:TonB-dependent receptor domain-containing protein n=1 Tax=Brevundimonas sp. TaxID=1871086 RepID=UPI0039E3259A
MTLRQMLMAGAIGLAPGAFTLAAVPAAAQTAQAELNLPAGSLDSALRALAAQSGERLLFDPSAVEGFTVPALRGRMSTDEALRRLLTGSELIAERTGRNVLVVRRLRENREPSPGATTVDEIVITGSLIRGAGGGPSPVVTLDRDEIDRQGYASIAQALQALPQNFGGTGNEGALQTGADTSASNVSYASGVNLRGLGSDATLVLVNGRRMAGSGARADFADISTIPTSAVERIEVLLDGASALYGSDAVGGVVNIILRRDFEGGETRMRAGSVTDGPSGEYGFAQSLGTRWDGGGGLISYEYLDREALPASERDRAGDADLRRFGGADRRHIYSNPGNIVAYDPAAGGYVPLFAIPENQNGSGLQPGDFLPGLVNLANQREGMNVLGRQTRHSIFAAGRQELGERLTLDGDLRWGRRNWENAGAPPSAMITVDDRNPHFVSPTGAASHQIAYSFRDEIGHTRIFGETENLGVSAGGDLRLPGDWRASVYAAYAREISEGGFTNQVNSTFLNEALGRTPDNPETPFSAPSDGYFNPFGDGAVNTPGVLAFISSGRSLSINESEVTSFNLQGDGTLMRLPAGGVRLAIGANIRREEQHDGGYSFTSGNAPNAFTPRSFSRQVAAVFAEARIPLFGESNRRAGLELLELSVAGRIEDYEDIGSTANPKLGVVWEPAADWRVRASWGTSFRAPALVELNDRPANSPSLLPHGDLTTLTMLQYGGNPGLQPEEAESWTAGLEYRPRSRPDLRLGASWFSTAFDQRIGRPVLDNILGALSDPALAPFIRFISPGSDPADRALIQALLDDPATQLAGAFPADAYGAVADARYVNTNSLVVEGIDLSGSWSFSRGDDRFTLGSSASWLLRYETQATPAAPVVSRLDTPNNPLDLRLRASADWSRGPLGIGLTLIHADSYADLDGRPIGAWTTADAQLRWAPRAGWAGGTNVALTVRNLFDTDPPFYNAPQGIAYDAANADVLGRFVALQVSRQW